MAHGTLYDPARVSHLLGSQAPSATPADDRGGGIAGEDVLLSLIAVDVVDAYEAAPYVYQELSAPQPCPILSRLDQSQAKLHPSPDCRPRTLSRHPIAVHHSYIYKALKAICAATLELLLGRGSAARILSTIVSTPSARDVEEG